MEALYLAPRRLSNADMMTALMVSVIAHITILLGALFLPGLMPHQAKPVNIYAVNLVSMNDLKGLAVPPIKGSGGDPKSPPAKGPSASSKNSDSQAKSSGPLVPVRRFQFDDGPQRNTPTLRKLETADKPRVLSRTENSDSLEKDLDKLTKKPKSSSKSPPAEEPAQEEPKPAKPQGSAGGAGSKTSSQAGEGSAAKESSTGGVPEGSANGSTQAGAGGGQVGLARRLYYTEIWNAIRNQWALPDPSKYKGMEAILVLAIRRDGKILDIRFQKRSGNALFDESAEKAVRKADPLPPFPAIYSPSQEEIGVRFRPEDL